MRVNTAVNIQKISFFPVLFSYFTQKTDACQFNRNLLYGHLIRVPDYIHTHIQPSTTTTRNDVGDAEDYQEQTVRVCRGCYWYRNCLGRMKPITLCIMKCNLFVYFSKNKWIQVIGWHWNHEADTWWSLHNRRQALAINILMAEFVMRQ